MCLVISERLLGTALPLLVTSDVRVRCTAAFHGKKRILLPRQDTGKTRAGPADGQGRGQVPRPTGFSRIPNAATLAAGTRGALCSPLSACAPGTPAPTHARPCPAPSSSPPGLPSKPTAAAPTPPTPPRPRPYRAVPETQRPDPFLHLPSHRNRKPPAPALGGRPGSGDHFVAARREGVAVSARHLDEKGSGGGGCGRRTGTPSRCSKLTSSTPTPCKPSSRPLPSSLPFLIPAPPHIPCRFCSSSLVRAHVLLVSLSASAIERVLGGFGGAASRRRRLLGLLPGLRNAAAREGDRLTDRTPVRPPPSGSVVVVALSVHARVAKRQ